MFIEFIALSDLERVNYFILFNSQISFEHHCKVQ